MDFDFFKAPIVTMFWGLNFISQFGKYFNVIEYIL